MVRVVLNRADSKVWLDPGEVERAIGGSDLGEDPERPARAAFGQQGRAGGDGSAEVGRGKSIVELARLVSCSTEER